MTDPDADEMSVNIYTQKAMALATKIQTGDLDGVSAERAMARLAEETLDYFRGWTKSDPQPTRKELVGTLDAFEAKSRPVQADFASVLGQLARLIEKGSLTA